MGEPTRAPATVGSLNLETVLEHMRAVLRGDPPDVKQAMRFADSQLDFMDRLDTRVRGKRDIDRQRGKLVYRRRFLSDAIGVLEPYGARTSTGSS